MRFEFNIEPVEQARPRATRMGKGIRLYDPKKVTVYKQQLGYLARQAMQERGLEPYDGPLEVSMEFYRPVQTSIGKKERDRRLSGVHRPTVKPDLDNYIKSTSDALNGIIWADDNLIISLEAKKFYAERPHLTVEIRRPTGEILVRTAAFGGGN
ncbi:RusA family crossover junction endodeoxyribonuclease [Limosilactobacillus fermentum]|uniref:RusA family crossover junction endodeoxyribonuclease n=1 Tax=Limosilactobacillus fermentum TaxID=1613 RepID=UPI00107591BD|nr:RusA family crossover junction endodeoxyribonuclease [Limosilactobacillus fermentum]TFZ16275.1 RusA family crossover junction endodeoxyribonuclease [Limosilactobacillus fermentum]TFZ16732.1 RusA family crossover junction endodeoxyribonuclease [Limosilactobacillus fermentum]